MTKRTTRRRYVAVTAATGLAAVAGCADAGPGTDDNESEDNSSEDDEEESTVGGAEDTDPSDDEEESVDHQNADGEVRFVEPEDGDTVSSPVEIELEVEDFELEPAQEPPPEEEQNETGEDEGAQDAEIQDGHGHLHVIVDEGCMEPGRYVPFTDNYHHLGEGGTEIELELETGEYDLCAQAADGTHVAYDLHHEISIEVESGGGEGDASEDGAGNESGGGE